MTERIFHRHILRLIPAVAHEQVFLIVCNRTCLCLVALLTVNEVHKHITALAVGLLGINTQSVSGIVFERHRDGKWQLARRCHFSK